MSAWIVSDDHINALLRFAIHHQVRYYIPNADITARDNKITRENADAVGRILMDENVASVNYRYEGRIEQDEKDAGANFRFEHFPRLLTPVEAIKGCNCLDYQSCEHDGWAGSVAKIINDAIRSHACTVLAGYDAAPWGIERDSWKETRRA